MNPTIIADAVSAYIKRNADLFKAGKENDEQAAGAQLLNVLKYFNSHPTTDVFYSSSNLQVFYTASQAWNHAQALNDTRVFHIKRSDVKELLEYGGEAQQPETKEQSYEDTDPKTLKAMCEERGIELTIKRPKKEDYVAALLADDEQKKKEAEQPKTFDHTVTTEDLENNPDWVTEGIKVGDIIQVPVEADGK